ncbi:hypothetical protein ElyMa_002183300 [Elysia marginata]|uniref:Uncharacterized protein n=1 Tax=Elysia marginata TaxID=1093978 RepID=A0AAV4FPK2_9GAST|nr:hypothetical protein ElyMa_002183300 [Elysia marginata]
MASSAYGRKLNPYRRLRDPLEVKGVRQSVVVTNNPSKIDQNQQLLVRFPNLGENDVIVPGTARLAFTISLTSTDANRTLVQNIGRAIVKRTTIRIILSLDDSDVFHCYQDLWKTARERENARYQGIDTTADRNATKLRVGAGDGDESAAADQAIKSAYGKRFTIPLDFELLESLMPFYQSALGDRLEYELIFNDYSRVIKATTASSYSIENISLEFDSLTNEDLARIIRNQNTHRLSILYDRVLRHRKLVRNKSDMLWNINLNIPARSMKGILLLCEEPADAFKRNTEAFYNPKITKVEVVIEGVPNQLYSQGLRPWQMWTEARKLYAGGSKRHPLVTQVAKDLALADVSLAEYLTSKYALWLDLRSTDDNQLHGTGRRVENATQFRGRALLIRPILAMAASLPSKPHSAIICGQTGCGKTVFILDLLEGPYRGVFRHIVILCPTIQYNAAYQEREWIWSDPEVYVFDPGERLHECIRGFFRPFRGEPTLYIIGDCSASKEMTKKKDALSELAFSGRHAQQSVWVLTQKYNSVLKDLREQTQWVALFHCKDRDSFEERLRENDEVPTKEERAAVRQKLAATKHAKLLLKTTQPAAYHLLY